jgi:hypothetical protein
MCAAMPWTCVVVDSEAAAVAAAHRALPGSDRSQNGSRRHPCAPAWISSSVPVAQRRGAPEPPSPMIASPAYDISKECFVTSSLLLPRWPISPATSRCRVDTLVDN